MASKMMATIAVLSVLLRHVGAQLLSCSDVNCPMGMHFANCSIEDRTFTVIGVSQFNSSLSASPLTWTVGYTPQGLTANQTEQKRYYLSTPRALNLRNATNVSGCAFFFTGIEAGLRFVKSDNVPNLGRATGTCADAVGNTCESDLTAQAQRLVASSPSQTGLQCSDIARALQSSPPASCKTEGTWGNITAKAITGSESTPALRLQGCSPTIDTNYNVHSVATFLNTVPSRTFVADVTPVMTIFNFMANDTANLVAPEVHLNCIKPMTDDRQSPMPAAGGAERVLVRESLPSVMAALVGFLAIAVFTA